jgi:glycosyltransferase involved in cell wall biosynthesis
MLVFRPHVLHLNTSAQLRGPWDTLMLAWATLLRVRSVYHIRMGRMPLVMKNHGWEWWGLRWALKLADRVVILDLASEQALKGFLPARRVVRMPNAIAVQPVANGQALVEPPSVLYLGHLIPTKGIEELMEAWRELRPQGWRLRLAGQGSAAYQRELLRNVGPDAGVEFLGALRPEAAWSRMQSAYIFVLPTHTEGFPNVILEAMAAGKAIISTRVGAIPEMLDADENEPCGLVITPRDAGALAAALRDLMAAPELRETLGRRAQVKVARSYTTDVVFEQLLHLWNDTARRRASIDRQSCSVAVK